MATVRDPEDDKVRALEAGADDYVKKPFVLKELIPRLRSTRGPSSFDIRHAFVGSYRYDFPLGKVSGRSNKAGKGWAISGTTCFSAGLPVTLVHPNDEALIESYNNDVSGIGFSNLDVAPVPVGLIGNPRNERPYFDHRSSVFPRLEPPEISSRVHLFLMSGR